MMDRSTAERLLAALPEVFHLKKTPFGEWIVYLTTEHHEKLHALVREAEQVASNRATPGTGVRGKTPQEVARHFTALVLGVFLECGKGPTRVSLVDYEQMLAVAIGHMMNEKVEEIATWFETKADLLADERFGKIDERTKAIVEQHRSDAKFLRSRKESTLPPEGEWPRLPANMIVEESLDGSDMKKATASEEEQ